MSCCGLPWPNMLPCRFFCRQGQPGHVERHIGVQHAAHRRQYARSAFGGHRQVALHVRTVDSADGDDDFVRRDLERDLDLTLAWIADIDLFDRPRLVDSQISAPLVFIVEPPL